MSLTFLRVAAFSQAKACLSDANIAAAASHVLASHLAE